MLCAADNNNLTKVNSVDIGGTYEPKQINAFTRNTLGNIYCQDAILVLAIIWITSIYSRVASFKVVIWKSTVDVRPVQV